MNKINRETISQLVFNCIKKYQVEYDQIIDLSEGEQTRLFGGDGQLDSLGLVSLVVNIEEDIDTELRISLILADEKAMSRRTSPFSRIGNLIDYINELVLNQSKNNQL
jgi:acyl carrier protein